MVQYADEIVSNFQSIMQQFPYGNESVQRIESETYC
jgi:hypothetical protein